MPSRKAKRPDDKRLAQPGKRDKFDGKGPRTVMERYLAGELKVSDMDDEELKKGWFRNEKGTFKGGRPANVPVKFYRELRDETIKRWNEKLVEELEPMKAVLKEIALNPRAPADARHKSAIYLMERVVGKVPDKSDIKVELAPWEAQISGILVDADEEEDEATDED